MLNNILLIVSIIGVFGMLLLTKKLFGRDGLIAWIGIATILAEIGVTKQINMLGMSATLGNVLFASNFLATDILAECYGEKDAKKGVLFGIFAVIGFVIATQIMLVFTPNEFDYVQESLKNVFGVIPRICISSIVMFGISNYTDVKLYSYLKEKMNGKYLWLRNNICTILCNGLENFIFSYLVFAGTMPFKEIMLIGLSTTIIEGLIALCDTPFLYLSRKIKN